jgi:tryptophan synthase beta chain
MGFCGRAEHCSKRAGARGAPLSNAGVSQRFLLPYALRGRILEKKAPSRVAPQEIYRSCPCKEILWGQRRLFYLPFPKGSLYSVSENKIPYKIYLSEDEMPKAMVQRARGHEEQARAAAESRHAEAHDLRGSAPECSARELMAQELDNDDREIPSPQEIRDFYKMYRPSPLVRAYCLWRKSSKPRRRSTIKFEGNNTSGSHKLNSRHRAGVLREEAGAQGRHHRDGRRPVGHGAVDGLRLPRARLQGVHGQVSYEQKPFRREVMRTYGASVTPSPVGHDERRPQNTRRAPGHHRLARLRHLRGGRDRRIDARLPLRARLRAQSGAAAPERHRRRDQGRARQVRHQARRHHRLRGRRLQPRRPHLAVYGQKLRGEADYRIIAVEPASCPSFTRGKFAYDFCDTGKVCPLAKMYTLGSGFIPSANHAGGLRYHGMSPILSQLYHDGLMEAVSVEQTKVFEAAE